MRMQLLVTLDVDPSTVGFAHTMEQEVRTHLESLDGVKKATVGRLLVDASALLMLNRKFAKAEKEEQ